MKIKIYEYRGSSSIGELLFYFRIVCAVLSIFIIHAPLFANTDSTRSRDVAVYKFGSKERPPIQIVPAKETITEQHDKNMRVLAEVPAVVTLPAKLVKLEKEVLTDMEKAEKLIFECGAIYEDAEVVDYINDVGRRILSAADISIGTDIRFKLIRDPTVNAFALPNGTIYLHTGILARLENEAQLAFTLAHEMSHCANKDGIYLTDCKHNSTVLFKLVDIILSPTSAFFGILGDLANIGSGIIYVSSVTGYGKAVEARADKDAINWVRRQGYDPIEASGVIAIFMAEKEKYEPGIEIYFLMNHPSNEQRLKTLRIMAANSPADIAVKGDINREEFLRNMVKIKLYNATLNTKLDRLEHAHDNIAWVLDKYPNNPEAHYLAGEIYRIGVEDRNRYRYELKQKDWKKIYDGFEKDRLGDKWFANAIGEYEAAIVADPTYTYSYKGLGLLYYSKNDKQNALNYLNKYLDLNNQAPDKRYISSLITKMQ